MPDKLNNRRKKASGPTIRPGTPEFGQRARERGGKSAVEIREERMKGDLRIKTARKRARGWKSRTDRYMKETE